MSPLIKGLGPAAGLLLALGAAGRAEAGLMFQEGRSTAPWAITVAITDRTDTITATINGQPVSAFDRDGERFSFLIPITSVSLSLDSASRDLIERPNSPVIDRLMVDGLVTNFLGVTFALDPATTAPGGTTFPSVVEDATFQDLFFATATDLDGHTAVVNFSVASDVEAVVPEPSTLVMAAGAVPLALVLWWRNRRRAPS
jgi:hypothetical protein